jgi:hypothetical protein
MTASAGILFVNDRKAAVLHSRRLLQTTYRIYYVHAQLDNAANNVTCNLLSI